MNSGWKPLPVILKIIFVVLAIRVFFSIFSIAPSFDKGFDFFGYTLYGLYAINGVFILKILLPLIILFGMYKRKSYTGIVAPIYFFIISLSIFLTLTNMTDMLERMMEQMPEMFQVPPSISEDDYYTMIKIAVAFSLVFSALFELALMILFIVKRKYFSEYHPEENSSIENKLPS